MQEYQGVRWLQAESIETSPLTGTYGRIYHLHIYLLLYVIIYSQDIYTHIYHSAAIWIVVVLRSHLP